MRERLWVGFFGRVSKVTLGGGSAAQRDRARGLGFTPLRLLLSPARGASPSRARLPQPPDAHPQADPAPCPVPYPAPRPASPPRPTASVQRRRAGRAVQCAPILSRSGPAGPENQPAPGTPRPAGGAQTLLDPVAPSPGGWPRGRAVGRPAGMGPEAAAHPGMRWSGGAARAGKRMKRRPGARSNGPRVPKACCLRLGPRWKSGSAKCTSPSRCLTGKEDGWAGRGVRAPRAREH